MIATLQNMFFESLLISKALFFWFIMCTCVPYACCIYGLEVKKKKKQQKNFSLFHILSCNHISTCLETIHGLRCCGIIYQRRRFSLIPTSLSISVRHGRRGFTHVCGYLSTQRHKKKKKIKSYDGEHNQIKRFVRPSLNETAIHCYGAGRDTQQRRIPHHRAEDYTI